MEEQTKPSQPPVNPLQPENIKQASQNQEGAEAADIRENKGITFLSYLGIFCLVPLLVKKDSKFAVFHAKQGLIIAIGWFIGSFLYVFFGLGFLVHVTALILSIMGLINVNAGKMKALPFVGDMAAKINF